MFVGFNPSALYGDVGFSRLALAAAVGGPATGITLSGPVGGTGLVNIASGPWFVGANGPVDADTTVTPVDFSGFGSFNPTTVTILAGQSVAGTSFTYTPTTAGARNISALNSAGLSDPPGVLYTALSTLEAADTSLYVVPARGRHGRRLYRTRLTQKDPEETIIVVFDYTLDLSAGEIISTPVVTCDVTVGTDTDAADMISGSAAVNGPLVKQFVVAGVAGNNYRLQCRAPTNYGQVLTLAAKLPVREA